MRRRPAARRRTARATTACVRGDEACEAARWHGSGARGRGGCGRERRVWEGEAGVGGTVGWTPTGEGHALRQYEYIASPPRSESFSLVCLRSSLRMGQCRRHGSARAGVAGVADAAAWGSGGGVGGVEAGSEGTARAVVGVGRAGARRSENCSLYCGHNQEISGHKSSSSRRGQCGPGAEVLRISMVVGPHRGGGNNERLVIAPWPTASERGSGH